MCGFRRVGALHLHAQVPERVSFLAAVYWRAYHYKQHINTAQAQTLAFFAPSHLDFPAYALFAPANSAQTISPGNMPIALPMQGTGGQPSKLQFEGYSPSMVQGLSLATNQPSALNINTTQSSSSNPRIQGLSLIPSYAASTIGGIANWAVAPLTAGILIYAKAVSSVTAVGATASALSFVALAYSAAVGAHRYDVLRDGLPVIPDNGCGVVQQEFLLIYLRCARHIQRLN